MICAIETRGEVAETDTSARRREKWRLLHRRAICRPWKSRTSATPSLLGKQLHWAVIGPLFRPLHLHLDDLVASWRELGDTVAERAVALGYVPDGQARAVAAGSSLTPVTQGSLEGHTVVWEATHRVAMVSERARSRMVRLGELDLASQDVLIEVVRKLEEQQWMLRAQLGSRA
jgi:starvation-inducible DNA-binding protein